MLHRDFVNLKTGMVPDCCKQFVIKCNLYAHIYILVSRLICSTAYITDGLGSITSSINHEQVKEDFVPSQECMVCVAPQIVHWQERNECYNPSFFIYTKYNQSTMSCMGNPQAIIRKCVHPSIPHSNYYSLGNRAKIPRCNMQKKCC